MNRRHALKGLILFAGGITLIPSCLSDSGKASIQLKNIDISADQEKLLAEIASTFIPGTDTPGAGELGAHLFALKMLDDCYEKEDQQKFVSGLVQFERSVKERFGTSFSKCTVAQREQALLSIENKEKDTEGLADFYKIMKAKTIQGYMTSRYVVVNIEKYEMIPSVAYNGYYPIKNTK